MAEIGTLPDDAELDCTLAIPAAHGKAALALLDSLFGPLGLPTGRLVIRDGLRLFTSGGGARTWLTVDYLVPGTRGGDGHGWDVLLNDEAGRTDQPADEPALDRWAVEIDGLPDWLVPKEASDG